MEKVREMYKNITTRKLSEKQKATAEKAFKADEETWPASGTGARKVVATEPERAEAFPQLRLLDFEAPAFALPRTGISFKMLFVCFRKGLAKFLGLKKLSKCI